MDAIAWKQSVGEPRVLISRRALLHNARVVRRHLSPVTKLCAIIKADAYGHGADIVADTLCNLWDGPPGEPESPSADALAVASLDEAAALPASLGGVGAPATPEPDDPEPHAAPRPPGFPRPALPVPVIVFRPLENAFLGRQRAKLEEAIRRRWVLTLCSPAAADDLSRIAVTCRHRAAVQVMVDSGMTRCGVPPEGLPELLRKIESRPSLRLVGLCTHFASADEPGSAFTSEQLARFTRATDGFAAPADGFAAPADGFAAPADGASVDGPHDPSLRDSSLRDYPGPKVLRHAANSGAIFFCRPSHLDMVRPGLCLYGIDPSGRPSLDRPLRPALKWTAPLVGVKEVPPGATVGYGQTWRALRRTRVGLVPVGYADGYPRCFSSRAVVMAHGRPAPVIGRVSMDLTTIDLTDLPWAVVGDEVTLLDSDPLSPASVYQLAKWSETIPYEVLCRIGPRVRRVACDAEDESPRQPGHNSSTAPDLA